MFELRLVQIVFLVLTASFVAALPFTDCGSIYTVHALRIQGCTATPCVFRKGKTYIIEMDATAKTPGKSLYLTVAGQTVFFGSIPILSGNACKMLVEGQCPVFPGNFLSARVNYTVAGYLPAIDLPVRFTVRDDVGRTPICGQIPARITY